MIFYFLLSLFVNNSNFLNNMRARANNSTIISFEEFRLLSTEHKRLYGSLHKTAAARVRFADPLTSVLEPKSHNLNLQKQKLHNLTAVSARKRSRSPDRMQQYRVQQQKQKEYSRAVNSAVKNAQKKRMDKKRVQNGQPLMQPPPQKKIKKLGKIRARLRSKVAQKHQ